MNDKIVMPLWTFGLFIVIMNTTMFNVSIPGIMHELHVSEDLASWIISSYSIGYALSTVTYSRLSDRFPVRRLVAVGLLILGLSSIYGIFARDFHALLLTRILQSAGAGAMAGLGLVLASRYIPIERRGRAISMISAGSAMAFGFGPIVGGIISEYVGWNGLFAVTCLVLVLLPVLLRLLPKEKPSASRFDAVGALLTIANAGTLLMAVTQRSLLWLAVCVLSIAAHAWHMKRAADPFVNPELLRRSAYRKLLVIGFCILVLNLGNLFLMPLALAHLFGKSPMAIGLAIAPGALLSTVMTRFIGRWIDRYGNKPMLFIGHASLIAVLVLFSSALGAAPAVILCGYLLFSPAYSATIASLNNETSRILPKPMIGSGMGLLQLIQFVGGSFSVAVCGILLTVQPNATLLTAYRHVYLLLLIVGLLSLVMLGWYARSAGAGRTSTG